jgi:hypothetical protein
MIVKNGDYEGLIPSWIWSRNDSFDSAPVYIQRSMNMTMNEILALRLDGIVRPHKGSTKLDCVKYPVGTSGPSVNIKVDFTGFTVQQVLDLSLRTLWISFQRVARKMTEAEYKSLEGKVVTALTMGQMPKVQVDPKVAILAMFPNMSKDEQEAFISDLMAKAKS